MKRRTYLAHLIETSTDLEISSKETYAWNSGVRASEALVREYARKEGIILTGSEPWVDMPDSPYKTYTRTWTHPSGYSVTATVTEITA